MTGDADDPDDTDANAAGSDGGDADAAGNEAGSAPDVHADADHVRVERSFRGISLRLAVRYLSNLGGDPADDGDEVDATRVTGDGWEATLTADTAKVGPSLTLTEVTVTFEGDAEVLDDLVPAFARKAMRAGG